MRDTICSVAMCLCFGVCVAMFMTTAQITIERNSEQATAKYLNSGTFFVGTNDVQFGFGYSGKVYWRVKP